MLDGLNSGTQGAQWHNSAGGSTLKRGLCLHNLPPAHSESYKQFPRTVLQNLMLRVIVGVPFHSMEPSSLDIALCILAILSLSLFGHLVGNDSA
eukprot:4983183-Amphidinium_carterae.1